MARARLRRGVELIKLANRIESLKIQEDEEQSAIGAAKTSDIQADHESVPISADAKPHEQQEDKSGKSGFSKLANSAIFREVVLAKVRDIKAEEERTNVVATGSIGTSDKKQ